MEKILKVSGIVTLVASFAIASFVFVSGIVNESAGYGVLISIGVLLSGSFFGCIELALAEILARKAVIE